MLLRHSKDFSKWLGCGRPYKQRRIWSLVEGGWMSRGKLREANLWSFEDCVEDISSGLTGFSGGTTSYLSSNRGRQHLTSPLNWRTIFVHMPLDRRVILIAFILSQICTRSAALPSFSWKEHIRALKMVSLGASDVTRMDGWLDGRNTSVNGAPFPCLA